MTFGEAADFYRLRVMRLDDAAAPDLEWRDDVLWRSTPASAPADMVSFRVEAVAVDDETAHPLADFATSEEAHAWMQAAEEDLAEMTKSEFEATYVDRYGE